jgi:small subunit ribosomal protein S20
MPETVKTARRRFKAKVLPELRKWDSIPSLCPAFVGRVQPFLEEIHGQHGASPQARPAGGSDAQAQREPHVELRTAVKKVKKAIVAGDKPAALKQLHDSQSSIDRVADKRIVHKNLASRTKSRLAHAIKAMP